MIKLSDIKTIIRDSIAVKESVLKYNLSDIVKIGEQILKTYRSGGKLILFGNGGSASDAQHIACEFSCSRDRHLRYLPAISLSENPSTITAIANDFNFDAIFAWQIDGLAKEEDCVIAISTSGDSRNVVLGAYQARKMKIPTVALTGKGGGELAKIVDIPLIINDLNTQRIQEAHIMIGHILWEVVCDNLR